MGQRPALTVRSTITTGDEPVATSREMKSALRSKRLLRDVHVELRVQRRSSLAPARAHLLFGSDVKIAGRYQGFRPLDLDQHHRLDWILCAFLPVDPLRRLAIDIVVAVELRATEESVTASRELLDDVDLMCFARAPAFANPYAPRADRLKFRLSRTAREDCPLRTTLMRNGGSSSAACGVQ
jgi:hypothetical protein